MEKLFVKSLPRSLDPKGRLMLPPEYRDALCRMAEGDDASGAFWLTAYYGKLVAYLPKQWDEFVEQLNSIPLPSRNLSNFKTKVLGLAQEMIPDAQGRVRIPQTLMREVGLQKDVMLVGRSDKFEIWDQATFDALPIEDISEELAAKGVAISL